MAVEDSSVDVDSAVGAGMFVSAWSENDLELAGADLMLRDERGCPWAFF